MPSRLTSAAQLMKLRLPEPKWAIKGIVPEGLTLLAGNPKIGKSWLAMDFSMAVATGGLALDCFDVSAGSVLHLALEDNNARLQSRLRLMMGVNRPEGMGRLDFATEWPRMPHGGAADIEGHLDQVPDTRLVVIDTLQIVRAPQRTNGNAYSEDYEAIRAIKRIADDRSIAVIVIHHLTKIVGPDPIASVSGSYGITGAADNIIVLRKEARGRTMLHVQGRDVEQLSMGISFNPMRGRWHRAGDDESTPPTTQARLLAAITDRPGASTKELAAMTGQTEGAVRVMKNRLKSI